MNRKKTSRCTDFRMKTVPTKTLSPPLSLSPSLSLVPNTFSVVGYDYTKSKKKLIRTKFHVQYGRDHEEDVKQNTCTKIILILYYYFNLLEVNTHNMQLYISTIQISQCILNYIRITSTKCRSVLFLPSLSLFLFIQVESL